MSEKREYQCWCTCKYFEYILPFYSPYQAGRTLSLTSGSNPCPGFQNCPQNDVTTVLFSLSSFCKKFTYYCLTVCVRQYVGQIHGTSFWLMPEKRDFATKSFFQSKILSSMDSMLALCNELGQS